MKPFDKDLALRGLKENGFFVMESFLEPQFRADIHHSLIRRAGAEISAAGKFGILRNDEHLLTIDAPLTLHKNAVKLATCPSVIDVIESYLDSEIQLSYSSAYRTKVVNDSHLIRQIRTPGVFAGWHSDANIIAPNRGYRCMVAMYYLSEVREGCGGLELIRGSHNYGGSKRQWEPSEIQDFEKNYVEVIGPAGTLIIFDMEMIHRAGVPSANPRDILRMMYGPVSSYCEPLIFSNNTLPSDLGPQERRILRLGMESSIEIPIATKAIAAQKKQPLWKRLKARIQKRTPEAARY